MAPSEIEPGTFRPVPQCQRHRVAHLHSIYTLYMACQVPAGTAAQLIAVTVCSIVLSRRLLFELPEQSMALQVFSFL